MRPPGGTLREEVQVSPPREGYVCACGGYDSKRHRRDSEADGGTGEGGRDGTRECDEALA